MDIGVSDIVSEVKICIDEIGLNDAEFLGTQDNEEMDTIITVSYTHLTLPTT